MTTTLAHAGVIFTHRRLPAKRTRCSSGARGPAGAGGEGGNDAEGEPGVVDRPGGRAVLILRSLPLRRKLVLFGVTVACAALLLVTIADLYQHGLKAREVVAAQLREQAAMLAAQVTGPLMVGDAKAAQAALLVLAADRNVTSARIHDAGGTLVARLDRDAGPVVAPLEVERPVVLDGEALGRVVLVAGRDAVTEWFKQFSRVTLIVLAVAIALAWVLASRLQRLVSGPILELAAIARRVTEKQDYGLRAPPGACDEFGQLADAFNGMLDQIQRRDDQLEELVRARTEELVRLNDRLKHQAYHDALTRLPNRALFDDRLTLALAQCERGGGHCAVLFLDLDNFKAVNDTLGHDSGDELLRQVAARISGAVRRIDTVARLGGDEFTVIVTEVSQNEDAARVARAVIEAVRRPMQVGGRTVRTTVSVGISVFPEHGTTVTALKRNADTAMYHAKARGRDHYEFYSEELDTATGQRLLLVTDLGQALERGDLLPWLQPIVDIASGRIVAVEALARWRHADRGLIPAAQFVPFAEETGVIAGIDRRILEASLALLPEWEATGARPGLTINVSLQTAREEGFADWLFGVIAASHVEPGRLTLEVSERALLRAGEEDLAALRDLRARGVRLVIDDFGSGYSALSYLPQCPVDGVKIDSAFVRDVARDRYGAAAVRAIAAMARGLDVAVSAKGIEDRAQQGALALIGLSQMQGAFIGAVQEPSAISQLLAERQVHAAG